LKELPFLNSRSSQRTQSFATLKSAPNSAIGSLAALTDLRKQAEGATSLLAAIVDSSDDAIVSKNLDGIITGWNKAAERLFGYTAKEAIGQPITMIIPADRLEEEPRILARIRGGKQIDHFETVRIRKDGALVEISLTVSPVRDAQGRIIGASKVARDISARKQSQETLRQSEQRLRNLPETLETEVRARTVELEQHNLEVLKQSDQLRQLSRRLLQIQDDERRHIARELHDSAGQNLAVLAINLGQLVKQAKQSAPELAEKLQESHALVLQLSREIRTMSYLLHPPMLDESGLSAALDWYVGGLTERSGLGVKLNISEDLGRLPRDMELVIFRVVQECLTNVHRHSGGKSAHIRIAREGENIAVEVQDDGRGMSRERLAEIQAQKAGVGIRGMRERVQQFHGEVNIQSNRSGTKVTAVLPVP
jgi:PAS domain S-box-containing protein